MAKRISASHNCLMLTVMLALALNTRSFGPAANAVSQSAGARRKVTQRGGVVLAYVPEGEFPMGYDDGPPDERPKHKVLLDAFWIGVNVVTVSQFRAYCAEQGIDFNKFPTPKWGWKDNQPMVNVTWDEARNYCKWVGGDLPTEAQWEKAARGTDGRLYPWGNDWDAANLWCSKKTPMDAGSTVRVGSYPQGASPFGCLDMEGNVFQWCLDWSGPYDSTLVKNPTGPAAGPSHVLRGGSWTFFRPEFFHVTTRTMYNPPILSNYGFGFRVVVNGVSG
jgi:formylglycine-generating enzyme required for sulfatase activity